MAWTDARVIATTGSPAKAARLRELGADAVVDYRDVPDWHSAVREQTGGRGVDRVVDTAGTLNQSLRSVAVDGHVALVGSVCGDWSPLDPRLLFGAAATVRAVAVGSRAQFTAMNDAIAAHRLRPVVDRVFPFEVLRDGEPARKGGHRRRVTLTAPGSTGRP
ncbi:zinc-binding dehydrogenase [Streptomyces sp. NPDC001450]